MERKLVDLKALQWAVLLVDRLAVKKDDDLAEKWDGSSVEQLVYETVENLELWSVGLLDLHSVHSKDENSAVWMVAWTVVKMVASMVEHSAWLRADVTDEKWAVGLVDATVDWLGREYHKNR
jgi:hypothetical protein